MMKKNNKIILVAILLLIEVVLVALFTYFHTDIEKDVIIVLFRHMLIYPLLGIIIISLLNTEKKAYNVFMLISFIVTLTADNTLVFDFMVGFGIFLICHILNSINFMVTYSKFSLRNIILGIAFMLIATLLYFLVLYAYLDTFMRVLLLIYTIIIAFSCWRATVLILNNNLIGGILVSLGAIFFLISDIIIGHYTFVNESNWSLSANDITYYIGLTLLALSTMFINNEKSLIAQNKKNLSEKQCRGNVS